MAPKIDLVGERFGRLTVKRDVGRNKHKQVLWLCECDCGNETETITALLKKGHTKSCGCLQKEKASSNTSKDLVGKRFDKLTVIKAHGIQEGKDGSKRRKWLCECECGGQRITVTSALTSGRTRSCGCIQREDVRERMSGENHYNYNPLLTEEERLKSRFVLGGPNAMKWRVEIFTRDNYTCKICKARNGEGERVVLNAHHLNGWHWFEEGRFDLDNGVTLCSDCHYDFHNKYGNKNNTKEQFEEYIQALA